MDDTDSSPPHGHGAIGISASASAQAEMEFLGPSSAEAEMEVPDSPAPIGASPSLLLAMELPVTASLGSTGPLLRQLHSFKATGTSLPQREIQSLTKDLEGLCTKLVDVSEAEDACLTAGCWMKEVRELFYDTEDCLSGAKDLSELMARVEDASGRHQRFELGLLAEKTSRSRRRLAPTAPAPAPGTINLDLDQQAGVSRQPSIVGFEDPINKLVDMLAFDDHHQKQLKVVPIFGSAGIGKTTLARTLYRMVRERFQYRAFLHMSPAPDIRRLLTSILTQIKAPSHLGFSGIQGLIDSIRERLQCKRYLIIIDDIWTASAWDIISGAFPDGNCCSRIITTTQIKDVALACCGYQSKYNFEMGPLNSDESRKLFFDRVFGSKGEGGCPADFKEVASKIIRKCGDSPLATVNIARLLASEQTLEQWNHIHDSLSPYSTSMTDPTTGWMRDVLNLVYNNLPLHLKTCLLYLSMYSEGYTIRKDDLVKQWLAERFIGVVQGKDTEKIAGGYFDELVSRGMIQAVHTNDNDGVLSCTVHHMVLDLIRCKSTEENFITIVDHLQTPGIPDKVRRLSVQFGGAKSADIPENFRMSQVRSLLFCGFFKCVPSVRDYGLLRVLILDIWGDQGKDFDLTIIGELFHLRYLKIQCDITVKLPAKIRKLQHLGTLQVDAGLSTVPSDIGQLEKLLHLRLPGEANFRDLGELTNLQDLEITCCTLQGADIQENKMKCLASILGKLSSLKCLALVPTAGSSHVNAPQDDAGVSSMSISSDAFSVVSPPPELLQRLELSRRCCIFSSLPKWIQKHNNLCVLKIAVRELSKEDIDILKELPALTCLSLYIQTAAAGRRIVFGEEGFTVLNYFKFTCSAPCLQFVKGAMPNLQKLRLGFNAPPMDQHSTALISIEHLSGLKEISAKIWGAGADAESILTTAVTNDPSNPKVNLVNWRFYCNEGTAVTTKEKVHRTPGQQGEIQEEDADRSGRNQNDDNVIPMPSESSSSLPISGTSIAKNEEGNLTPEEQHEIVEEDLDEYYRTQDEGSGGGRKKQASSRTSTLPESSSGLPAQDFRTQERGGAGLGCFKIGDQAAGDRQIKPASPLNRKSLSPPNPSLKMRQDIEENKMEHPSEDVNKEIHSGISTKSESSSHLQNPVAEHKTVAVATEDGMVSASTGAMNSLLSKLAILIGDEYANLRGNQVEVIFLKDELRAMNAVFEQLADRPGLNIEMKRLRNQMREMTYDVEDWIDDLMLQSDEYLNNATGYPEKWEEFMHQIQNLTAQAEKADLPVMVERTEIQTLQSSYKTPESGLHTLYNKAVGLVSIDGPRDELVKWMNGGEQQLQVACILGSAGLGKTTLATEVYNHIKRPFDHRAFIQVPRKIDIIRLHEVIYILRQLGGSYYQDTDSLVETVKSRLQDGRYLIVIDGVRSAETWKVLESALPKNNRGSRILVTTDERDIALSCKKHFSDFIYRMELLNAQDSLSLFGGILFGSDRSRPMELENVAEKIVAACGGIPMAIIIMAGILASKPVEAAEWEMVEKRMEPVAGDGDVSKEIIRKMFHISYSALPRDIKSCLLYLSVFPENQFIRKDRLVWRWIAEGFVPKRSGESSWETGERYFLELIVRNLIEPVYEEEKDDYEVPVGCKVHGLILEFITSLSNEENLVTTMAEATDVRHDVIRRLSASYMKKDHISRLISTQHLSKVRSITTLRWDQGDTSLDWWNFWEPLLLGLRFLRVLDLEDAHSFQDKHLEGTIKGLVLLRYLGLEGTGICRLPEEIGKVEQLETLDLRRNKELRTLPASIASLRKLVRLLVDPRVHLPSEISKMQELEQVSTIGSISSLNSVAELLVKSKSLRMLDVNLDKSLRGATKTWTESFMSFLRVVGKSNLQSLSLNFGWDRHVLGILLDSWEVPPRHLRRFKLEIRILGGVVPPRMASLVSVTHLDIWISELEAGGVRVLGDFPNLVLLKLTAQLSTDRCVISGEKSFQCLKVFTLRCRPWVGAIAMGLQFTPGAMPQLQRLRLSFSVQETLSLCGGFDFGIQHLSCLARLHATINCKDATVSEVEAAEVAIRRQVSEFPIKPTVEFNREFESRMREDEATKEPRKHP